MDLLKLQIPIYETIVRSTLVYLAVCILIRLIPKRQAGNISPQDMVGAVIVGGLTVAGITPSSVSPADVVLMIVVILFWNYLIDWTGNRFPWLRRFIREPPACLIRDGRMLRQTMRREMVTEDELLAQLRKQGIDDIGSVRIAYLETDGQISVVKAARPAASGTSSVTPKPGGKTKRGARLGK